VGNRLTETDKDGNITTYTYNAANQLAATNAGGTRTTYTYDNNGNLHTTEVTAGTTTYTYDYENRLTVVTYPDDSRTTFSYNGEGKRVQVQEGAGTIEYLYDLDKVVLERDGSGGLLARYTHEGGSLYDDLVSMKRGGASYYFLFDGLGSVTEVVDGSENTQNSYRYEAFGQVQSSTQNVTNPYRYVGAYGVHWDATPALYFMQARYYAPDIGRFITMDPLRGAPQDPLSLHRYLYVTNNPQNKVDPRGLGIEHIIEWFRGLPRLAKLIIGSLIFTEIFSEIYQYILRRAERACEEVDKSVNEQCEPAWRLVWYGDDVEGCENKCYELFWNRSNYLLKMCLSGCRKEGRPGVAPP